MVYFSFPKSDAHTFISQLPERDIMRVEILGNGVINE